MELVRPIKPKHPIFTVPRGEKLRELLEKLGEAEFNRRMELRNRKVEAAELDPYRCGVRLSAWKLVEERLKTDKMVIVLGGNQSSKSELGAYLSTRALMKKQWWRGGDTPVKIACMHTSNDSSVRQQQKYIHKYLPPELRDIGKIGRVTNICYTQKNGFSDNAFVTPDGDECAFFNYQQEIDVIEGYTLDWIWADELLNGEWLKTLPFRTMALNGRILVTVTLVHGMIGAIKEVLDACEIVKTAPVDPSLFSDVTPESALARGCPPGQVPVLAVDGRGKRSVIWMHTQNNPFTPRANLMEIVSGKPREFVLIRAYGYCESTATSAFPKFSESVHVISAEKFRKYISEREYTLYMSADPGGAKPWFVKYYAVTDDGCKFLLYESPDFEEFGAWAEPPDKDTPKPKWKRGPAHGAYAGAGIISLKRLFKEFETRKLPKILGLPEGASAEIFERYIDPRMGAMTVPGEENDTSFISLMEEEQTDAEGNVTGESVLFTAAYSGASGHGGSPIEASVEIINTQLDYDPREPVSRSNMPKFYMLDTCQQSITAYKNFSCANSRECPLKDIIDPDRYFFNMDPRHISKSDMRAESATAGY